MHDQGTHRSDHALLDDEVFVDNLKQEEYGNCQKGIAGRFHRCVSHPMSECCQSVNKPRARGEGATSVRSSNQLPSNGDPCYPQRIGPRMGKPAEGLTKSYLDDGCDAIGRARRRRADDVVPCQLMIVHSNHYIEHLFAQQSGYSRVRTEVNSSGLQLGFKGL